TQGQPDTVENEPGRFLRDTESAVNLVRTDSVLAVHGHPQRRKPLVQWNRGILKNRALLHAELARAFLALPSLLCGKVVVLGVIALRADWPIRPAQRRNRVDAHLFVAKMPD